MRYAVLSDIHGNLEALRAVLADCAGQVDGVLCLGDLAGLPLTARLGEATLVHASPRRPDAWEYVLTAAEGFAAFTAFDTALAFVGHSHLPGYWSVGAGRSARRVGAVDLALDRAHRYIVNVGSVGQPRDRDPRASYAIWDRAARRVAIRRVPYDLAEARRKI